MCRHAEFEVPPEPRSVPSAREFCRDTLLDWALGQLVDDAVLILSELVTNGVLHAATPLQVTVSTETGTLEIAVSDGSRTSPVVRPPRADLAGDLDAVNLTADMTGLGDERDVRLDVGAAGSVVGGRGLHLVVSLAADWGVDHTASGKSVWARVPVPSDWAPAARCPCRNGTIRLSSGRMVAVG